MKHRTSIEFTPELWRQLCNTVPDRKKSNFITEAIKDKLARESTKAVILCGGEGTRMRPLTLSTPKPMLPLGYRPMIEHTMTYFKNQGIYNFVLAIGYLGEHIIKYFNDGSAHGMNVEYSTEHKALGTAGAVKNAEKFLHSPFLVVNGDVIFRTLNVKEALQFHKESNALVTIVTNKVNDAKRFGLVESDSTGKVTGFVEKPKYATSGWINAGLYIIEPDVLEMIKSGDKVSMEAEIFPKLVEQGKLFDYKYNGYWMDIGMPEDYEKAQRDFFTKK
ncbi:MAG TPA: nucleotidyltransferase family protein [archaeon]|nr:nucleotidyltransferase family protein [archaeon]